MITLNRTDMDFLLRQVTINYLKPDPNNPGQFIPTNIFNYSALTNALDPSGVREVAGTNNNLVGGHWDATANGGQGAWAPGPNGAWGESSQPFLNLAVGQSVGSAPEASYNDPGSPVADADPRLIANLVSTMYTSGPLANPAAALAATNGSAGAQFANLTADELPTAFVANAGVLGGGRYNEFFVSFGQFFDHGLDFVNRNSDPNATVTIALSPNDPLAAGADHISGNADDVTSIQVRRADVANASDAGGDGVFGTADDAFHSAGPDGVSGNADDIYSRPEYTNQTGLLIDQSQTYGSHQSVNALLREYDAGGHPTGRVVAANTTAGPTVSHGLATWADVKANAARIGVALQDSDVHNAPVLRVDPAGKLMFTPHGGPTWSTSSIVTGAQAADDPFMRNADGTVMRSGQDMLIDFNPGISLDAHIITGDGRANENIGVTSMHHIFHEEHNAEVENIRQSILGTGDAAFIAQWQTSPGVWDGEKLYQAARLITESEYNHIAIDQYVGTLYGALPEFVSYSSDINPGVSLEFSQAVFRLGHSMLTETLDVTNPNTGQDLRLLDMFLNPTLYTQMLDAGGDPSGLMNGLLTTLGNEVDEFVTPALQQALLGQPLDLAAINITRGREVGLPTWMEFRDQVYNQLIQHSNNTNGSALAPYNNWADVIDHLKSPETGVNLIAAYAKDNGAFDWGINEARDAYMAGAAPGATPVTLQDIREKAQALYDAYLDAADPHHADAVTFMEGTPTQTNGQWTFVDSDRGFWDIDLWLGGLAERPLFDGPLGTTFSYVILDFAQRQQDGDRFYYLYRTPMGTNLGNEIIENQFANLVMEHTGLEHVNGEAFIWANKTYELGAGGDYFNAATQTVLDVDGSPIPASSGHIVVAGNGGDDYIIGGLGDDTVYGDAGNDQIHTSQGNDHAFGGDGNDTIVDDENDDFLTGGAGNDVIFAGPGVIDTVFGDEGDDELHGGDGIDEVLGGPGNDLLYGDGDTDVLFGDDGDDYIEGGDSVDEMSGQAGNDWMRGGVGDDHLQGGDGNDLLEGGLGPTANDGDRLIGQGAADFAAVAPPDLGFDVASYEDVDIAITANLETSNQNGSGGLLDTYVGIDGLVGSGNADNLTGAGPANAAGNGVNNLLVGGAGGDTLTGLGGDDLIFGDSVVVKNDLSVYLGPASGYTVVANWKGTGEDRPDFGAASGGLGHFLGDNGTFGAQDTAVFSGNFADYQVVSIAADTVRLIDKRGIDSTAVGDLVKGVEQFQFASGTRTFQQLFSNAPTDIRWNPATADGNSLPGNGQIATLTTVDPDTATGFTYQLLSQSSPNGSFTVNAATGAVTRAGGALTTNTTYVLNLKTTDPDGLSFSETIRILTGTGSGNSLTGNGGDDVVYALAGDDTLNGLGGDDNLLGQNGADMLEGGAGNDRLDGGGGTDTASYAGAAGRVIVSLAIASQQDTDGAGMDTLVSIENITGSAFNDTLTGNSQGNALNGGAGDDMLTGGAGADVLTGGAGNDVYIDTIGDNVVEAAGAGGGVDAIHSTTSGTYTLNTNVENFEQLATSGVTVNGNGSNNQITGNLGADTLNGNAGADTLSGGDGADRLDGGDGADTLSGDAGADTLGGGAGADTLSGGEGADTLSGGDSADRLSGDAGNDTLNGGAGADTLAGGFGNDRMDGGAGDDIFVFDTDYGVDTIVGFDANPGGGQDLINLAAFGITAADFGSRVTITDTGNDTVIHIGVGEAITLLGVNGTGANIITINDFQFT